MLVRTPSFFKSQMTSDVFVRHYTEVADASPVPVLLYNVTMFTGVNLLPDAVETLAAHPNIVGMKESGSDIGADCRVRRADAGRLHGARRLGDDARSMRCAPAATARSSRWRRSCPTTCVQLRALVREGRLDEARALQRRLHAAGARDRHARTACPGSRPRST